MSTDKRSVSTDALETLGTIIDASQKRDAIHLAVEPVVAGDRLHPGDHITVKDGVATATVIGAGLGIVDPFLPNPVKAGERFWFVMYPRQVRSLRHVWSHPAFEDEPVTMMQALQPELDLQTESEKWIRKYADEINVGYQDLMDSAYGWIAGSNYMVRGGVLEGVETRDEFWDHFEVVSGVIVPHESKTNFFSCSC